jgi:hypothetical protein
VKLVGEIYDLAASWRETIRSENWQHVKAILDEKDWRVYHFQEIEKCENGAG